MKSKLILLLFSLIFTVSTLTKGAEKENKPINQHTSPKTPSTLTINTGYLASALTMAILTPQIWKTYNSGEARSLSYPMIGIGLAASATWIIYGFGIQDLPIIITNIGTGLTNITLLILKYKAELNPESTPLLPIYSAP